MGMATYYLKAKFKSELALTRHMPQIRELVNQGIQAESFWQDNRKSTGLQGEAFWSEFKKRFPLVYEYLGDMAGKGMADESKNDLAGKIDFGENMDDITLEQHDDTLEYSAYVWHFADWDLLADYLKTKFGATNVSWISDEYTNPFDELQV